MNSFPGGLSPRRSSMDRRPITLLSRLQDAAGAVPFLEVSA